MMEIVWQAIVNAVIASVFYILVTVGLTLSFGIVGILNFAHGELYMVGAYTVWLLYAEAHWPFFTAVVAALLLVGVVGVIIERGLFRPLRGNPMGGFIIAFGVVVILQVVVGQAWGFALTKPVPAPFPQAIELFGAIVKAQRVILIPAAIFLLGALWFFLYRLKTGWAMRAYAQESEGAALQGVNIDRTAAIAMGLGCAFAGVAGALMAPVVAVHPYMGAMIIWKAFIIVIVGGIGSVVGAILASLLFGFLDVTITTLLDAAIANIVSVVVMLLVLTVRPWGLMGRAQV